MSVASIKNVPQGSMITFRSKNPNNVVQWRGTLESVGTYRSIRHLDNPAAENEAVRQNDPSVSSDVTTLTYFLITLDNGSTNPNFIIYADEWIETGSLNIINPGNKVTIEVTDPAGNSQAIVSLLASGGYASKIIS